MMYKTLAYLLVALGLLFAGAAHAAEYTVAHPALTMDVGFPAWGFDTGWQGFDFGIGNAAVRLTGGIDGTVLGMNVAGAGKLECPTAQDQGQLRFAGAQSTASQNLGIRLEGQYRVQFTAFGTPYNLEGTFPIISPDMVRLQDSATFTAYNLGNTIVLADAFDDLHLFDIPVGIQNVLSGSIGLNLTAGDRISVTFNRLNTSQGAYTADGQVNTVATPGASLTVNQLSETVTMAPDVTLEPTVQIRLNIAGLTDINFNINIPSIPVPLASLINTEQTTTPLQSITFGILPTLTSININNNAENTINRIVHLFPAYMNGPTQFMASEDPEFWDGVWTPLSADNTYTVGNNDSFKRVYFKLKNAYGESNILSDTIYLMQTPPTIQPKCTRNPSPALNGTVRDPNCTVTVRVAGQNFPAVNNRNGTWNLANDTVPPLPDGTYNVIVIATDTIGNTVMDQTVNELIVDNSAPSITVESKLTNDCMTSISGTVSDPTAFVYVQVWVYSVQAINNGDGTWILPRGAILLLEGDYDVQARATDAAGNLTTDPTTNELHVDLTHPTVTVDPLATGDMSPSLTGAVDDPTAAILVFVGSQSHPATNNGDGTWRLADNVLTPLVPALYNVSVTATDAAGNIGADKTINELLIDNGLPACGVNPLTTNDTTPRLTGTLNRATLSVVVVVNLIAYPAINNGDGTWVLPDNTLAPLADGVYDVMVEVNESTLYGYDTSINELIIDTHPPTAQIVLLDPNPTPDSQVRFGVNFDASVGLSFNESDVTLAGSLAPISIRSVNGGGANYIVTATISNALAEGDLGIQLGTGVADIAGNAFAGMASERYTIVEWCGFAERPMHTRAYLGGSHTFTALPACGAASATYEWKWEDNNGSFNDIGGNSPTLTLTNISGINEGQYWCEILYGGQRYISQRATLLTIPELIVIETPEDAAVTEGKPVTFRFRTYGGYSPIVYSWTREGVPVPGATDIDNGTELNIEAATEEIAGIYRVDAVDDNGVAVGAEAKLIISAAMPAAGPIALALLALLCACIGARRAAAKRAMEIVTPPQ